MSPVDISQPEWFIVMEEERRIRELEGYSAGEIHPECVQRRVRTVLPDLFAPVRENTGAYIEHDAPMPDLPDVSL